MNFLEDLGFTNDEINEVKKNTPKVIQQKLIDSKSKVIQNIEFLIEYGITNYKDIVIKYSEMFLMDSSNFQKIFLRFDKEDLIEKLTNNPSLVEYL